MRGTKRRPNPVDVHVGSRLRLRRKMLGLSQTKLGELLGLTFQQVQKYERGTNRVGASRLYELGSLLDVPVSFFFEDVDPVRAPAVASSAEADPSLSSAETRELVEIFYSLDDLKLRKRLIELAKQLAEHQ